MMETIHLPTFRGIKFSCGFCTQKLNKMNKKMHVFEDYLSNPTTFISISSNSQKQRFLRVSSGLGTLEHFFSYVVYRFFLTMIHTWKFHCQNVSTIKQLNYYAK